MIYWLIIYRLTVYWAGDLPANSLPANSLPAGKSTGQLEFVSNLPPDLWPTFSLLSLPANGLLVYWFNSLPANNLLGWQSTSQWSTG